MKTKPPDPHVFFFFLASIYPVALLPGRRFGYLVPHSQVLGAVGQAPGEPRSGPWLRDCHTPQAHGFAHGGPRHQQSAAHRADCLSGVRVMAMGQSPYAQ